MGEVKVTKGQIACIKAMFNKLNTTDADAVVLGFSPGSEGHVSKMLVPEGAALIRHLKSLDPEEKAAERMRRKLIALAHELQWHETITNEGLGIRNGKKKVDMKRLDAWCRKYGQFKKSLNQHNVRELPGLISQFEIMYVKDLKKV